MTTNEGMHVALSWLGTYAIHSTLFLSGAWALCAWRAPRANRNRERLWKLSLLGGVLSATLQLAFGGHPWSGRLDWPAGGPEDSAHLIGQSAAPETQAVDGERELPESAAAIGFVASASRAEPSPAERTAATKLASVPDPLPPAAIQDRRRRPVLSTASGLEPVGNAHPSAPATKRPAPERVERQASHEAGEGRQRTSYPFVAAWSTVSGTLRRSWPGLLFLGWTVLGIAGLLGIAASWTCLRRRMLGRQVLDAGPLVERLTSLHQRSGMKAPVRLSVSARVTAPFSTGFWRPEICVPTAVLTDLSPAQQEALLAHELAHLVRRDSLWFGAIFLIEKVFFFQPLNRLARRELTDLAELACDDWAVRLTGARLALASCLTEVAQWVLGEPRRRLSLPGLAGHRSHLGRRVVRLLDDRRSPAGEPRAPWWPPAAAAALATVVLAVPGVSAGAQAPERDEVVPTAIAPVSSAVQVDAQEDSALPPESGIERSILAAELELLQGEIDELHAELERRALHERFAEALARIDERMATLLSQQARVRDLLARLAARENDAQNTPVAELDSRR